MDFAALGRKLVGLGAPVIGTALGGPLGGAAAKVLADALGARSPSPDAIAEAIDAAPPASAAASVGEAEAAWAEAVRANAELAKVQVQEVNKTMRAELAAARPDGWWGHWRERHANFLVLECPIWVLFFIYGLVTNSQWMMQNSFLITAWWGARFGLLGVHVYTGSQERKTAMTGENIGGVVSTAIKAIRGK